MSTQYMKAYVKSSGDMIRNLRKGEVNLRDDMRSQRSYNKLIADEVERVTGSPRNYQPDLRYLDRQRLRLYHDRMILKDISRHLNLAYAFARGRSYEQVEQTIREGNEPDAEQVLEHILDMTILVPALQDVVEWLEQDDEA